MKLFTAKVTIASVANIAGKTDEWTLAGSVVDNTGMFMGSNVSVSNIIYAYSTNSSQEVIMSRYKVTEIVSVSGGNFSANIKADEPGLTEYNPPDQQYDCIIGELVNGNMAALSGSINGVNPDTIVAARNVDTKVATFINGPTVDGGTF